MGNFIYKRTLTENMKVAGNLNIDAMTIEVDGIEKSLSTLLSPFAGSDVELRVNLKSEEELAEPTSEEGISNEE